ncbi:MAG: hypothetical protein F4165_06845, partial [Acidimicrobiia bacterium]|nr:hypothetical protein [Acidimicrobiia bacterium]
LGGAHSCAIKSDDTLVCWGSDIYGQATPPSGAFKTISLGTFQACGIKTDDTFACWGFGKN